jgi:hypothetical protein
MDSPHFYVTTLILFKFMAKEEQKISNIIFHIQDNTPFIQNLFGQHVTDSTIYQIVGLQYSDITSLFAKDGRISTSLL